MAGRELQPIWTDLFVRANHNHCFSMSGVVKLLLQHGADPGRLDKDELSCASCAGS